MLIPITRKNSTVDGQIWNSEWFDALDLTANDLCADGGYPEGCLKYVRCSKDEDSTVGHRVRSKFPVARPVQQPMGIWMWDTEE